MQLYLIRHPRPLVAPGICYGQQDLPLAEPVHRAAAALRAVLHDTHPAGDAAAPLTVVSSPLQLSSPGQARR